MRAPRCAWGALIARPRRRPSRSHATEWTSSSSEPACGCCAAAAQRIKQASFRRDFDCRAVRRLLKGRRFPDSTTRAARDYRRMKIVAGNSNHTLAQAIGAYLGLNLAQCAVRRFADQEIFVE